jgi:hypothetical protein
MKKILFIPLLWLVQFSMMAQKVSIELIKTKNTSASEWQVLDEHYRPVFSSYEYFSDDSEFFSLEANMRFFLQISVYEIYNADTSLYSLLLNGEPIMLISSKIEPGDHFYPFFTGIKTPEVKITGGTSADISDFPWQVYFESGIYTCGGSIISENWVVTAAHCTKNSNGSAISASDMAVEVGANNPRNGLEGKKYSISEVIVHEDYNNNTLENDIALLKLKEPLNFENAKPIKLILAEDVAEGATDPGVMSWVTGWGLTSVRPSVSPTSLQKVQLPIVTNSQAATVWKSIPETDIMAGFLNGNKDACSGDSGGPLVVPVSDEYKLAGIVSWGSSNCNTYGGYTRVSYFETWIRTKTGMPKEYIPPAPVGDSIICQGTQSGQYSIELLPDATVYEWKLLPEEAGNIFWDFANATVLWDKDYTGSVTVKLRVTINNVASEWSKLNAKIVKNTILLSQSSDTTLCAGQPIRLNANAEGYKLIYNWYHDNSLVQSGASGQMNIPITSPDNSGNYICETAGTCGTVFSNNVELIVLPLTRIAYISPDIEVHFGTDVTLEVNGEGHDLTYQWQKDTELLDNTNTPLIVLHNLNATDIGLYQLTLTGTCGTVLSEKIYVYVRKENSSEEPEVFLRPTISSNEFRVALSNDEYYDICLFNSLGKLMEKQINCRYQSTINVITIPRGVYIIKIYNKKFSKLFKVIKN